ncbi:MAG: GNAT family N-acetyltransferase [Candidatus Kapaibacterium sp.]
MLITNNTERSRFETLVNGEFAYLDYEFDDGVMNLFHTFVPPKDRHQGIAFELVKIALEYAKREHLKVIDGCPTVTIFIDQHKEYVSLLVTED